jgi:hypothetical protein
MQKGLEVDHSLPSSDEAKKDGSTLLQAHHWSLFQARVWQVGFVMDKVASGQVFSEYFGFPCQNHSFHQLLHHHRNHSGQLAEALRRADHPSKESCRLS